MDPSRLHLMGHGLGAHIFSYFGKNITGLGRITGFDPAQPGFEGCSKEVRLDKSDANFVDVIHTNCEPFIPYLGVGMFSPIGNDFFLEHIVYLSENVYVFQLHLYILHNII